MKSIHIYWHIAQLNNWHEIANTQLATLQQSGLYDASTTINAIILGDKDYILPQKIKTIRSPKIDLFEFPTLALLWDHAQKRINDTVLYFHTKGVNYAHDQNIENWRQLMESCLINHWPECVAKLHDYATVGIEFRSKPSWHYSGNFWWSTREHLTTLPQPRFSPNRHAAEMWILSNHPMYSTVLQHGLDLYRNSPEAGFWTDYDKFLQRVLVAGSDNLDVFGGRYEGGLHLQQRPEELATFIYIFKDLKITTLWEIGSAAGGLAKFLQDFYQIKNIIIIDDKNHPKSCLRDSILTKYTEFTGDSHSPECRAWLAKQQKPELVIIDGDHSYEGVKQDLKLCLDLVDKNTIICLHDSLKCEGVRDAVNELRHDPTITFVFDTGDTGQIADGLGLIALRT